MKKRIIALLICLCVFAGTAFTLSAWDESLSYFPCTSYYQFVDHMGSICYVDLYLYNFGWQLLDSDFDSQLHHADAYVYDEDGYTASWSRGYYE